MEDNNPNQALNSTEPELTQIQSSNPVSNKRGGFAIILGVVLVLLFIGGGTFYYLGMSKKPSEQTKMATIPSPTITPTPIPTITVPSDWKKFKSQDEKLTLSYPPDWSFIAVAPEEYSNGSSYSKNYARFANTLKDFVNNQDVGKDKNIVSGGITLGSTSGMGADEKWKNINEKEFYNPSSTIWHVGLYGGGVSSEYSKPEKIVLGNNNFIKQLSRLPADAPKMFEGEVLDHDILSYSYYTLIGDRVLSTSFTVNDKNPNKETLIKTFEQILSTLAFTNQKDDISSWKTYKSDITRTTDDWDGLGDSTAKVNWSFQYPAIWTTDGGPELNDAKGNKVAEFISLIMLKPSQTCFDKVSGIGRQNVLSQESYKTNDLQVTRRIEKTSAEGVVNGQRASIPEWIYFYCAQKKDKAFYLFFYGDEKGTQKSLFDQVVSTFKLD
jgi:hypothetical protein